MNIFNITFNRTYLKLISISIIFAIIFCFFCTLMVEYILQINLKLISDTYYEQVSRKVKNDINILKDVNSYIAKNKEIIDFFSKTYNSINTDKNEQIKLFSTIKDINKLINSLEFVDTISLIDLKNNKLFFENEIRDFDITKRPYYKEDLINTYSKEPITTSIYNDILTTKESIGTMTKVYDNTNNYPIGIVFSDIYIEDLINYIKNSFYLDILEINIISSEELESLNKQILNNDYFVYLNNEILNDDTYIIFAFNKNSILDGATTGSMLNKMKYSLWITGISVGILLFISIEFCFKSTLISINKLKSILYKLDNTTNFIENKNEFIQLEILADTLNKSFDNKIQELIYYDGLTGLPNRKFLENFCENLIQKNENFALIFIDLNKFKYINDVFGHTVGDDYLIKFSNIIKQSIEKENKGIFTRYSGDEFILVYESYVDDEELLQFYNNNIVSNFVKPIRINDELTTEIGFSAGVAVYPKDANSYEDLINKSDFMMYITKKSNIHRKISFFNDEVYNKLIYSEKIKNELKNALQNNEFYLNYQPIIDKDFNISKAEVLIRWNNKELGFIPPDKFIKHLEENRQIIQVGYWVIEEICKEIKNIKYKDMPLQITINISPLQLMLKDFIPNLKNIIQKYNVNYNLLCFEITETVLLDNKDIILENINQIRKLGIQIALDDFGTGYSSFNYLINYKLDILKIDKAFLKNNKKLEFDIIKKIKELSHILDMEVIMEGVETKEQFDIMKSIGIDYLQGYYFSKPLSLQELKNLLKD